MKVVSVMENIRQIYNEVQKEESMKMEAESLAKRVNIIYLTF